MFSHSVVFIFSIVILLSQKCSSNSVNVKSANCYPIQNVHEVAQTCDETVEPILNSTHTFNRVEAVPSKVEAVTLLVKSEYLTVPIRIKVDSSISCYHTRSEPDEMLENNSKNVTYCFERYSTEESDVTVFLIKVEAMSTKISARIKIATLSPRDNFKVFNTITEGTTTEGIRTEKPTTKQLITEKSTTEQPRIEISTSERPTTKKSTTEISTSEGPTTKESTTEISTSEGLTTEESVTKLEETTTEYMPSTREYIQLNEELTTLYTTTNINQCICPPIPATLAFTHLNNIPNPEPVLGVRPEGRSVNDYESSEKYSQRQDLTTPTSSICEARVSSP